MPRAPLFRLLSEPRATAERGLSRPLVSSFVLMLMMAVASPVLAQSATQAKEGAAKKVTSAAQKNDRKTRDAKARSQEVKKPKAQKVSVKRTTAKRQQGKSFARTDESGYDSLGSRLGLRSQLSEIALNSSAVMVVDQETGLPLLEKNSDVALPIASITKVMTAIVTLDADLSLSETITIEKEDAQLEKYSASRLGVGARFTRAELLHLALMSSENRAAQALGRSYPGGLAAFVAAMNRKADELGMTKSKFVEPTGLSSQNVSTPRDLSRLVNAAYAYPLVREYSTDREAIVRVGGRQQQFRNTNALTRNNEWDLGLSKTGFIRDAGKCLVMQATIDDQNVIIVMLDAQGSSKRISDAERIRKWLSADRDRQPAVRS
ncbi:MAG: D-alanyl-D-alanine endopeptidase [Pseudomonadota bacterium]